MKKLLILLICIYFLIGCSKYSIYQMAHQNKENILDNTYIVVTEVHYGHYIWSPIIYEIFSDYIPRNKIKTIKKQHREMAKAEIIKFKEELKRRRNKCF